MTGEISIWPTRDELDRLRALRAELLQRGRTVFDLSMVNPDLPPPRYMVDKLLEATMKLDNHRYAVSRGVRKLREAFAHKYREEFNAPLDPEQQVCVTFGTKNAILDALWVIKQRSQEQHPLALLLAPSYPAHQWALEYHGFRIHYISSNEETLTQELEELCARERPAVLLTNFPNNPTGRVLSLPQAQKILQVVQNAGSVLLNDFVYGEMVYSRGEESGRGLSFLSIPGAADSVLETYSLSKAYNVPGWRVGALLGNTKLLGEVARLKAHIDYGVFLPLQIAAAAALTCREKLARASVSEYEQRARVLGAELKRHGWEVEAPAAGASLWARLPQPQRAAGSMNFCERALTQQGILAMPGSLFGIDYREYVRFALVLALPQLHEIGSRLEEL